MRTIRKSSEPTELARYRATVGIRRLQSEDSSSIFNDFPDKDEVRRSLVEEQRGLCCYCLARIRPDAQGMRIEHWHCQTNYPGERLDYSNLLGACKGNEGPEKYQHCDVRKKDLDLFRNPADPSDAVEMWIHFQADGRINSDDPQFDTELNRVLNLNAPFLVDQRKEVLDGFIDSLPRIGQLNLADWRQRLAEWNGESNSGDLRPYCQVVVYWLRKKVRRG
jgi:uncharacterized protein (TIGR02646 family)